MLDESEIAQVAQIFQEILTELSKVIVGQSQMIQKILLGLITGGHILLEGVPGLGKTLTVQSLAKILKLSFHRLQFTPDLLPADLIGSMIYKPDQGLFEPKLGPIFAHLILADEINRAPAKVQSALLEAMQEGQVTLGDQSHPLPQPFFVMATQNPLEQEGTYPLPEAQLDRFMFKIHVDYPTWEEERQIIEIAGIDHSPDLKPKLNAQELVNIRALAQKIHVDDSIKDYIVHLVFASRQPSKYGLDVLIPWIEWGASPRATLYLYRAAKAHALLERRSFVIPEDVQAVGFDVLRHRIVASYQAEADEIRSVDIIQKIFESVPIP